MELTDEQIEAIKSRLAEMSPEELEELKNSQGLQQCSFCLMHEGKIQANIVYQDKTVMAVLDIHPANKGHILLFPRMHYPTSFMMNDISLNHIFNVMNELGRHLVKMIHAEGVNYFMANGEAAGQKIDHFLIHIIPRFRDDSVLFNWKEKQISEEDTKKVLAAFRQFSLFEEKPEKKEEVFEYEEEERVP